MLDDSSQYALLAIGGPSIALAVGVLLCILNRQRKKRTLRFDAEVDKDTSIVESSTDQQDEDLVDEDDDSKEVDADVSNKKDKKKKGGVGHELRKRKLHREQSPSQPVEEDSVVKSREHEYQLLGSETSIPSSGNLQLEEEPKPVKVDAAAGDEAELVSAKSEAASSKAATEDVMRDTEPTLIAPPMASPKGSPILEKQTTVGQFWQQCKNDSICKYCNTNFTVWTRRHHCRNCCASVCASCSSKVIALPGWEEQQRVCNECYQQLSQVPSADEPTETDGTERQDEAPVQETVHEGVTIEPQPTQDEIREPDASPEKEEEQPNPLMGQSAFVIIGKE